MDSCCKLETSDSLENYEGSSKPSTNLGDSVQISFFLRNSLTQLSLNAISQLNDISTGLWDWPIILEPDL